MPTTRALFSLLLVLGACASVPAPAPASKPAKPERLAECLARKGAHLYGASWCHWCHVQLELFGTDAPKIPYTDCDPQSTLELAPECKEKGFELESPLPTWIFGDGTRAIGVRSLKWLAHQTGCPAP